MNDRWLGTPPGVLLPRLKSLLDDLERLAGPAGTIEKTDAVIIRNCMLAQRPVPCLLGEMFGHPSIKDGPGITSEIYYLDQKRKMARTISRWYHFDQGLIG